LWLEKQNIRIDFYYKKLDTKRNLNGCKTEIFLFDLNVLPSGSFFFQRAEANARNQFSTKNKNKRKTIYTSKTDDIFEVLFCQNMREREREKRSKQIAGNSWQMLSLIFFNQD